MAAHSSIFAWRIAWTEEPGGLWSMGCKEWDMTERGTLFKLETSTPLYQKQTDTVGGKSIRTELNWTDHQSIGSN